MGATGAVIALLVSACLVYAAWNDIVSRTIPNAVSIIVALLGLFTRLMSSPSALLTSLIVALLLFTILVLLHARGLLGGGDVKLAAAICLGLSPFNTYRFIFVTAMAGGALSLVHLTGRYCLRNFQPHPPPRDASLLHRVLAVERWRIARHGSLCYGVAIACGGIWAIMNGPGQ